jgi:hypothetical protein
VVVAVTADFGFGALVETVDLIVGLLVVDRD